MKPLKLVLTDHWFEEIKSGRKTHEYRNFTLIGKTDCRNLSFHKGTLSSFKKHIGKTLNV